MKRMLQDITTRTVKPSLYKLPWIFLIALVVSGCAGAPQFPVKDLWETHTRIYQQPDGSMRIVELCRQYEIYDPVNFKFRHVKDWDIRKCHGTFGFATTDVPKVFDWGYDMNEYVNKKCGK